MKEANSDVCFGLRGFSAYRQEDEHAQYVEAYGGHVVVDELPGADVRSEPRVIHCPAKDEADPNDPKRSWEGFIGDLSKTSELPPGHRKKGSEGERHAERKRASENARERSRGNHLDARNVFDPSIHSDAFM